MPPADLTKEVASEKKSSCGVSHHNSNILSFIKLDATNRTAI